MHNIQARKNPPCHTQLTARQVTLNPAKLCRRQDMGVVQNYQGAQFSLCAVVTADNDAVDNIERSIGFCDLLIQFAEFRSY
jgi:hypothetical protein